MITGLFTSWSFDQLTIAAKTKESPLSNLSKEAFAQAVTEVVASFGGKGSVFADISRLAQNPLVGEFAQFLIDTLPGWSGGEPSVRTGGLADVYLQEVFTERVDDPKLGSYVLLEEAGRFVELIRGTPLVRLHVSKPLSGKERLELVRSLQEVYPGSIPLIKTDTALLGGVRLFVGDTLIDRSWVSRVHTFLSSLS